MNNVTVPYTYLLKHLSTNTFYYGCRYAKGCNPSDFWVKYYTSSKYVKALVEENGKDSFEFEIRQTFDDVNKCREWESRVLKRLKVASREDFINKTDNRAIDPLCAIKGSEKRQVSSKSREASRKTGKANKGKKRTLEQREIISESLKGNTRKLGIKESEESREKKRQMRLGKSSGMLGKNHSEEAKLLQGRSGENHWNFGKRHSEETLRKMRKPRGPRKTKVVFEQKVCPHCCLTGGGANMSRYHFNNCKLKEN